MTPQTLQTATAILTAAITDKTERAEVLAKLTAGAPREKWLTTAKAAALAGCHRKSLFRWARAGLLHPERITASRVRWPRSEVEKLKFDEDAEG